MKKNKKSIALYPPQTKFHTIHDSTIAFLKSNYNVNYNPIPTRDESRIVRSLKNPLFRRIYLRFIRGWFSKNYFVRLFHKPEKFKPGNIDLVFSSNLIPPAGNKFIMDLESVIALSGYEYRHLDAKRMERIFSDKYCKAIICWNEISRESLTSLINCKSFYRKIHVVPFAINPIDFKKNRKTGPLTILFVSSINNPHDFERKGGVIAIESYLKLLQDFPDLRFLVRSRIPSWVRAKYGHISSITFIEKTLTRKEMSDLFNKSHLLLEPIPGINLLLECMNFGIPIIASDFWATPEMVLDGKNGFIVDFREIFGDRTNIVNYVKNLEINYLKMSSRKPSNRIINEFAKKTRLLVENPPLRRRMSKNAGHMIKGTSKYSLATRNKSLSSIFKNAFA